jgi:hypothetical protein
MPDLFPIFSRLNAEPPRGAIQTKTATGKDAD